MMSPSLVLWGLVAPLVPSSLVLPSGSATPEPAELVGPPDPKLVSPGTVGFLVTFGVAVALVLLVRDMVRRNRGLVVRSERHDAELRAEQDAAPGTTPEPPDDPGGGTDDRRGPGAPTG